MPIEDGFLFRHQYTFPLLLMQEQLIPEHNACAWVQHLAFYHPHPKKKIIEDKKNISILEAIKENQFF